MRKQKFFDSKQLPSSEGPNQGCSFSEPRSKASDNHTPGYTQPRLFLPLHGNEHVEDARWASPAAPNQQLSWWKRYRLRMSSRCTAASFSSIRTSKNLVRNKFCSRWALDGYNDNIHMSTDSVGQPCSSLKFGTSSVWMVSTRMNLCVERPYHFINTLCLVDNVQSSLMGDTIKEKQTRCQGFDNTFNVSNRIWE